MAALAVLVGITATSLLLLGWFVAISFAIKRVDKHGSLRCAAPSMLDQGTMTLTGAHAARWDHSSIA